MYKTNRMNHDFQLAYFIAGSYHTPDAAWSQMCDQEDDRVMALNSVKVAELRLRARKAKIERNLKSIDDVVRLEAQADMLEYELGLELHDRNVKAAEAELATIRSIKAKLEPLRKFKYLPDDEAHQAAQQEEWKWHLLFVAQNQVLSTQTVAPDYIGTMRQHPEFETVLLPALDKMRNEITRLTIESNRQGKSLQLADLSFVVPAPEYSVPLLMDKQGTPVLGD